jgi:hypothetical protein
MPSQEQKLREQYLNLITVFEAAFPGIQPPAPTWFGLWLSKYNPEDISNAIQVLEKHPLKARFTTDSTGRALSALLREAALRRAIAIAPTGKTVRS